MIQLDSRFEIRVVEDDAIEDMYPDVSISLDTVRFKNPRAFTLMFLISKLDPDQIFTDSLRDAIAKAESTGLLWKSLQNRIIAISKDSLDDAIVTAAEYSLIQLHADTFFSIHRCIQAEIRNRVSKVSELSAIVDSVTEIYASLKNLETEEMTALPSMIKQPDAKEMGIGEEELRKTLARGALTVRRLKIVLLGQGRAGKTSLLRAFRGMEFREREESTVYISPVEVEQHFLENKNWANADHRLQLLKSVYVDTKLSADIQRISGEEPRSSSPSPAKFFSWIQTKSQVWIAFLVTLRP